MFKSRSFVEETHLRIFLEIFLEIFPDLLRCSFMCIDNTVKAVGYAGLTSVTISSGSDRCSAAFTIEHKSGIFGNFKSVISEPLTDLTRIYSAGFGYFADTYTLVLSDVFFYFLEFSFGLLPAKRADRRSCDIIEELSAVLTISYVH